MTNHLDTSNPIHAKAILRAASHFLSSWDQSWDAEKLALVLVEEEHPERENVLVWQAVEMIAGNEDPFEYSYDLIRDLAESFIDFLEENQ